MTTFIPTIPGRRLAARARTAADAPAGNRASGGPAAGVSNPQPNTPAAASVTARTGSP